MYKTKVVEVDAFKYDGDLINSDGEYYVPDWAAEAHKSGILYFKPYQNYPCELFIKTHYGDLHVKCDEYVIQGVNGELRVMSESLFDKYFTK